MNDITIPEEDLLDQISINNIGPFKNHTTNYINTNRFNLMTGDASSGKTYLSKIIYSVIKNNSKSLRDFRKDFISKGASEKWFQNELEMSFKEILEDIFEAPIKDIISCYKEDITDTDVVGYIDTYKLGKYYYSPSTNTFTADTSKFSNDVLCNNCYFISSEKILNAMDKVTTPLHDILKSNSIALQNILGGRFEFTSRFNDMEFYVHKKDVTSNQECIDEHKVPIELLSESERFLCNFDYVLRHVESIENTYMVIDIPSSMNEKIPTFGWNIMDIILDLSNNGITLILSCNKHFYKNMIEHMRQCHFDFIKVSFIDRSREASLPLEAED